MKECLISHTLMIILRDIFVYASWFRSFECTHVPRACNIVSDILANHARIYELGTWVENVSAGFIIQAL